MMPVSIVQNKLKSKNHSINDYDYVEMTVSNILLNDTKIGLFRAFADPLTM
jgi:hypothetical protein